MIPKPRTWRSAKYLTFIRSLPCAACGAGGPSEAHHEGSRGMGIKASDATAISMCRFCHQKRHQIGIRSFWGGREVDIIQRLNELYHAKTGVWPGGEETVCAKDAYVNTAKICDAECEDVRCAKVRLSDAGPQNNLK